MRRQRQPQCPSNMPRQPKRCGCNCRELPERTVIASRVAAFKARQDRLLAEREAYYEETRARIRERAGERKRGWQVAVAEQPPPCSQFEGPASLKSPVWRGFSFARPAFPETKAAHVRSAQPACCRAGVLCKTAKGYRDLFAEMAANGRDRWTDLLNRFGQLVAGHAEAIGPVQTFATNCGHRRPGAGCTPRLASRTVVTGISLIIRQFSTARQCRNPHVQVRVNEGLRAPAC